MKTRMVSSATSFQRLQTSLQSPMPRLPRSNVYSTRDPANPSASVHRKRFFTPSLTLNISMRWLLESGIGNSGEKFVSRKLHNLDPEQYKVIDDLMLPAQWGRRWTTRVFCFPQGHEPDHGSARNHHRCGYVPISVPMARNTP